MAAQMRRMAEMAVVGWRKLSWLAENGGGWVAAGGGGWRWVAEYVAETELVGGNCGGRRKMEAEMAAEMAPVGRRAALPGGLAAVLLAPHTLGVASEGYWGPAGAIWSHRTLVQGAALH